MIEAPLNALMAVLVPLLKEDATLQAMTGQRVFDHVPADVVFPYIARGSAWEMPEDADCLEGVEIGFRLDVYSRAVGQTEARRLAHLVKTLLHNAELDLPEGALAMLEYRRTDQVPDARDPNTTRLSVEFSALVET